MTAPEPLSIGTIVRVKPLNALGTVVGITQSLRKHPYLVDVCGQAWHYAADELERLPPGTVLTLPPFGMMGP